MVTKEEEQKARNICAYCNFVCDCEECIHREWPSGRWINKARWDYKECEYWKEYLVHPIKKFYRKIMCLLRLHNWYTHDKLINKKYKLLRECTRIGCNKKQKYISNKDYTKGKWVNVDVEDDVN